MQDRPRPRLLVLLLMTPLAGLGLLLAVPDIDVVWEHHPSHFLLVLVVALINVAGPCRERGGAAYKVRLERTSSG